MSTKDHEKAEAGVRAGFDGNYARVGEKSRATSASSRDGLSVPATTRPGTPGTPGKD